MPRSQTNLPAPGKNGVAHADARISSFEKNPEANGRPAIAYVANWNVRNVMGIFVLQPAHLADVLLAAHRVNHRAGSEEEAGFEERVRDEMEDAGGERTPTPTPMNMKPSCETVE